MKKVFILTSILFSLIGCDFDKQSEELSDIKRHTKELEEKSEKSSKRMARYFALQDMQRKRGLTHEEELELATILQEMELGV